MKDLTSSQLDSIISKADKTFDSLTEAPQDNYIAYHNICEAITKKYDVDYNKDVIDDRCIALNKLELDRIM